MFIHYYAIGTVQQLEYSNLSYDIQEGNKHRLTVHKSDRKIVQTYTDINDTQKWHESNKYTNLDIHESYTIYTLACKKMTCHTVIHENDTTIHTLRYLKATHRSRWCKSDTKTHMKVSPRYTDTHESVTEIYWHTWKCHQDTLTHMKVSPRYTDIHKDDMKMTPTKDTIT